MTRNDRELAAKFDIQIECAWFASPEEGRFPIIAGTSLLRDHPIIAGTADVPPVRSIAINNCTSLRAAGGSPLVCLSREMTDWRNGFAASDRLFAHALDCRERGSRGRVVTVADSGFIGTSGTSVPGPGLADSADNMRFLANTVLWLARELG